MKTLLTVLLLAFTIQVNAQELVKNQVDEFTGNKVIQSSYEIIEHTGFSGRAYLSTFYSDSPVLMINVISRDSWQILGAKKAQFIIDEERKEYSLHQIDTEIQSGSVIESYGIIMTKKELVQLANASDIRFRINRNVYTVTQNAKGGIQLLLNEI